MKRLKFAVIADVKRRRVSNKRYHEQPNSMGKAVISIATLCSMGFLTAHKSRNVQPVIKVPPIPIISLVCKSGW